MGICLSSEIKQLRRELDRQRVEFERFSEVIAFERETAMLQTQRSESPDVRHLEDELEELKTRIRMIENVKSEFSPDSLDTSLQQLFQTKAGQAFTKNLAQAVQQALSRGEDCHQGEDYQSVTNRAVVVPGEDISSSDSSLEEGESYSRRRRIRVFIRSG